MIRKRADLLAFLEGGGTLAKVPLDDSPGRFGWMAEPTGETVHTSAVKWAASEGKVQSLRLDIGGEPMRYGAS